METDLHLTRDNVVVLTHDPFLTPRLCRELTPDASPLAEAPAVRALTLDQIRRYAADHNSDPAHFPGQSADVTPAAALFAKERGIHPYAMPASPICSPSPAPMPGRSANRRVRHWPNGRAPGVSASTWS